MKFVVILLYLHGIDGVSSEPAMSTYGPMPLEDCIEFNRQVSEAMPNVLSVRGIPVDAHWCAQVIPD